MPSAFGYFLLFLAALGVAVGLLVFRADPRRWDNRTFALMALVDAATEAMRAARLLAGHQLIDSTTLLACLVGSIFVGYISVEFAYSFPFNRRLPGRFRVWLLGGAVLSTILVLHPATQPAFLNKTTFFYFLPYCILTLALLIKNLKGLDAREDSRGIRMVMLAIAIRWISAMITFAIAKPLSRDAFLIAISIDASASMLISYILLAHSILAYQLFRVRGFVADVIVYGSLSAILLIIAWVGVGWVMDSSASPIEIRALLTAVALAPIALVAASRKLIPKIERLVIEPIDPKRARKRDALARVVDATAGKLEPSDILLATSAIWKEIAGTEATFLRGPAFPKEPRNPTSAAAKHLAPALARWLETIPDTHIHRGLAHDLPEAARNELRDLPGNVLVPVRRGSLLFGALSLEGGTLDHDLIHTARTIAEQVALKLENYRLFAEMIELKTELEEATRLASLGSFAAAIAHDIRTPLTSIQMNVQILRNKCKLPTDDMEYFDIALQELKRLNENIGELLNYAKPVTVKRDRVDLRELADDAARSMDALFLDKKLQLERHHDSDLAPVLADATRLRQVFQNLLSNAAQASAEGASIELRTRMEEDRVAVDVVDHGRGIEADYLAKIFEPFFTTRPDGTGLGLAIAHKLIRAHAGEIRVDSSIGKGSTFTVLLPKAPA